ncbi:MAG: sigma-70 family RNA polymerase sigma factor [Oscillospiraceae bacterium]|nr:sigma-70 family RNA polymerase sigma factor [Oscillospiraceae bacterium]
MEDAKIIELYFDRNEFAIAETSEKYTPYCSVIAKNILHDERDEEECLSDTWLAAWNNIPPTKPNCLKAFLGKITRNISLNMFRKKAAAKRSAVFEPIDELSECMASNENVEQSVDKNALSEYLDGFIRSLSPEKRYVFLRRYWYCDSLKDIADSAKISEIRVKNILAKLRKKLKENLQKEGFSV